MLTCIACSKQQLQHRLKNRNGSLPPEEKDDDVVVGTPRTNEAIKTLTAQVKEECECFGDLHMIAKKVRDFGGIVVFSFTVIILSIIVFFFSFWFIQ